MLKRLEVSDPTSCLNRADDNEIVFVLLARDVAAPAAIAAWVKERIRVGKNHRDDEQITDALTCAIAMARQQKERAADG